MKITHTSGKYFYFSLDDDDYKQYGFPACRKFLNVFKKEIPYTNRFWLKEFKAWSIKKECKPVLDKLLEKYFNIIKQKEIF